MAYPKVAFFKGGKTGTFLDKAIAWWTRGPYSHCAVVLSTDPITNISQMVDSNHGTGVKAYSLVLDPADWDIMDAPDNWSVESCKTWFDSHMGQGYDYLGLLGIISPVGNEYKHWFCSEAVGASFGIKQPWRFDPNRLVLILRAMGFTWDYSFSSVADAM